MIWNLSDFIFSPFCLQLLLLNLSVVVIMLSPVTSFQVQVHMLTRPTVLFAGVVLHILVTGIYTCLYRCVKEDYKTKRFPDNCRTAEYLRREHGV